MCLPQALAALISLKTGPLDEPEVANLAKQAGQQVPETHMCPPYITGSTNALCCPKIFM